MYKTTDVHIGLCVLARQKVLCNVKSSQLNTDTKSCMLYAKFNSLATIYQQVPSFTSTCNC